MWYYDAIEDELLRGKSLAALLYLINGGRELEFTVDGRGYFISRSGSEKTVSLWQGTAEQSFDSMEELLDNALIDGEAFLGAWPRAELETLF